MEFHLHVHTAPSEPAVTPAVVGAPGGLLLALLQAAGPVLAAVLKQLLERLAPPTETV